MVSGALILFYASSILFFFFKISAILFAVVYETRAAPLPQEDQAQVVDYSYQPNVDGGYNLK